MRCGAIEEEDSRLKYFLNFTLTPQNAQSQHTQYTKTAGRLHRCCPIFDMQNAHIAHTDTDIERKQKTKKKTYEEDNDTFR